MQRLARCNGLRLWKRYTDERRWVIVSSWEFRTLTFSYKAECAINIVLGAYARF